MINSARRRKDWACCTTSEEVRTRIKAYLDKEFFPAFTGRDIKSIHLLKIIKYYSKDPKLIEKADKLRTVEAKARHVAAHQITAMSDEDIKKRTGLSSKDIMELLRGLFNYTGISIKDSYWNSYEDMNGHIMRELDS
ncbi:MAG: hypothetical protein J6O55_00820 [Lachnospiraceae bacterium]|nr:hypothetical protein [Lachnospiraceae bacterium]